MLKEIMFCTGQQYSNLNFASMSLHSYSHNKKINRSLQDTIFSVIKSCSKLQFNYSTNTEQYMYIYTYIDQYTCTWYYKYVLVFYWHI